MGNLRPGSRYTVNVLARDTAGNVSWASPPLTITTGSPANSTCSVRFTDVNNWGSGYVASIDLTNKGQNPIDGWTFLVDQTWEILRDEHELTRLSAGTWLLASSVEERAMGFDTTCWTDGAYTWEVLATDRQLFVIGAPPSPFADLVRDLTEGPDVVDELNMLSGPPRTAQRYHRRRTPPPVGGGGRPC